MNRFLPSESTIKIHATLLCRLVVVSVISIWISACVVEPDDQLANANLVANGENKPVCRYRMVTGSNIPKRDCRPQQSWDAVDELERRTVDEYKRQTTESSGITVGTGGTTQPDWDR